MSAGAASRIPIGRIAATYLLSLPLAALVAPAGFAFDASVAGLVVGFGWLMGLAAVVAGDQRGFRPGAVVRPLPRNLARMVLGAFVALILVYGGIWKSRVPLFFTSALTLGALRGLLPQGPVRFLDAGCGDARVLTRLAAERPESRFEGVEQALVPWSMARLRCRLARGDWRGQPRRPVGRRPVALRRRLRLSLAGGDAGILGQSEARDARRQYAGERFRGSRCRPVRIGRRRRCGAPPGSTSGAWGKPDDRSRSAAPKLGWPNSATPSSLSSPAPSWSSSASARTSTASPLMPRVSDSVMHDPLMTFKVLRYIQQRRRSSQVVDVTTIAHSLMMLGINPFLGHFARQEILKTRLAENPIALQGARAVIGRARHAALYARDWAVLRHDIEIDEVTTAALLHDLAELLVWCFTPTAARPIAILCRITHASSRCAAKRCSARSSASR